MVLEHLPSADAVGTTIYLHVRPKPASDDRCKAFRLAVLWRDHERCLFVLAQKRIPGRGTPDLDMHSRRTR